MLVDYKEAISKIRGGEVILYPSDTLWALGCDARNQKAVEKIKNIKKRPDNKAFIILISKIEQLTEYVVEVPDIAWNLVEFAEKPLTVVYPNGKNVAPNLLGEDGSIAIRLLKDDFCRNFVYRLERAIVSTSANYNGESSPTKFEEINPALVADVDFVLRNPMGENKETKASQIIKLGINGNFSFIRR